MLKIVDNWSMNKENISSIIKTEAPKILDAIKQSNSILLHLHPSPDPDSAGSALAMMLVLKGMGKKATVIAGDSEYPLSFKHFPGSGEIAPQNFIETDLSKYDLFIALDAASKDMISRRGEVKFPDTLKVIVIDHHVTNTKFGHINLVEDKYPATCQILHDLFHEWGVGLTPEIASDLFVGIYTDTGGFKYPGVSRRTFESALNLSGYVPSIPDLIGNLLNSNSSGYMKFLGLALNSIKNYGAYAVSIIDYNTLSSLNVKTEEMRSSDVSSVMNTVSEWNVSIMGLEIEPNKSKFSLRSRDAVKYDVSALAASLGGGGHKNASGIVMNVPIVEAEKKVVDKIKEMYNL